MSGWSRHKTTKIVLFFIVSGFKYFLDKFCSRLEINKIQAGFVYFGQAAFQVSTTGIQLEGSSLYQ